VAKQGTWYLVARALSGMRTYRVFRMQNAVALVVTFERPAHFDLAAYWKRGPGVWLARPGRVAGNAAR
jgi:predicted DNA-binding transcriptional regulator YafY